MTFLQLINGVAIAIVGLAALSLIVNPNGRAQQVVTAVSDGFAKNVSTAKSF